MIGSEFTSSRAKLGRAKEHLDVIDREITKWSDSEPCVVFKESDPDTGNYLFWVEIAKPPSLIRWSLITGDIVHNLRSALDNMVWELAVSGFGPSPPRPKVIQFPIADNPAAFAADQYRIASLSTDAQTRIEMAQPYHRLHPELPPLLSLVRDFNNLDKHRLLNVVVANVQQGHISLTWKGLGTPEVVHGYDLGPIEGRTKVASLAVKPPQPDMNCTYEGAIVISIGHTVGPSGRSLGELHHLLTLLYDEVEDVFGEVTF